MGFFMKKTFAFQKQQTLLNMSGYCYFPGFVILQVKMHLTACIVFCLVMVFLQEPLGLKIYFHSPSMNGQVLFLTLELIVKEIDPSHESVQSLHFSTWPNLEAIFSHIKGSSHEINLLCDRKYKHEVQEDRKVLAPITDTVVTLGRLDLLFRGNLMTQSIIQR